jgi:hypothetical protein
MHSTIMRIQHSCSLYVFNTKEKIYKEAKYLVECDSSQ